MPDCQRAAGLRAERIHIKQSPHAGLTTNTYITYCDYCGIISVVIVIPPNVLGCIMHEDFRPNEYVVKLFPLTDSTTAMSRQELGGYDYEFVDTPLDYLICNICHYPCRDSYLSSCCGHLFCKSCLEEVRIATTVTFACPICRSEEFATFPNKQVDRAVRSLHVYCTNKQRGCVWKGEVNNIINHLENSDGCQYEVVQCPNGCGKVLQRQYMTSHVETECSHGK